MDVVDELFARADALMGNAPGTVGVRRISHIDDVRALRAARAALSEAEAERLRHLRLELMERLDGAVAASATGPAVPKAEPDGFFDKMLSVLRRRSRAMRTQGITMAAPSRDDRPTRLPAPTELLDAAEAWLISHWVADRVPEDLTPLRTPWEESELLPADS